MNVWAQVDKYVAKHKARAAELVELAKAGKVFRKPRFTPPHVWTLIPRAQHKDVFRTLYFTDFEQCRAALQTHADATARAEKERADAAKATKAKPVDARLTPSLKKGLGADR